jgi:hypothetical protein
MYVTSALPPQKIANSKHYLRSTFNLIGCLGLIFKDFGELSAVPPGPERNFRKMFFPPLSFNELLQLQQYILHRISNNVYESAIKGAEAITRIGVNVATSAREPSITPGDSVESTTNYES